MPPTVSYSISFGSLGYDLATLSPTDALLHALTDWSAVLYYAIALLAILCAMYAGSRTRSEPLYALGALLATVPQVFIAFGSAILFIVALRDPWANPWVPLCHLILAILTYYAAALIKDPHPPAKIPDQAPYASQA